MTEVRLATYDPEAPHVACGTGRFSMESIWGAEGLGRETLLGHSGIVDEHGETEVAEVLDLVSCVGAQGPRGEDDFAGFGRLYMPSPPVRRTDRSGQCALTMTPAVTRITARMTGQSFAYVVFKTSRCWVCGAADTNSELINPNPKKRPEVGNIVSCAQRFCRRTSC